MDAAGGLVTPRTGEEAQNPERASMVWGESFFWRLLLWSETEMHVLGMVCVRVRARVLAGMGRCARPCVLGRCSSTFREIEKRRAN